jgi:hypothetical protein
MVNAVNDVPVAIDDVYEMGLNLSSEVEHSARPRVVVNDLDADGNPFTAVLVTAPNPVTDGTLTLNANGSFTYQPNRLGDHTFTYRVNDGIVNSANIGVVTIHVFAELITATVGDGGSVTTDTDSDAGATATDPVETTVTTPTGGDVTIKETAVGTSPTGYTFLGQQVTVTVSSVTEADPAEPANPLILRFRLDASQVVPGENGRVSGVPQWRAGARCTYVGVSAEQLSMDPWSPCVANRRCWPTAIASSPC